LHSEKGKSGNKKCQKKVWDKVKHKKKPRTKKDLVAKKLI